MTGGQPSHREVRGLYSRHRTETETETETYYAAYTHAIGEHMDVLKVVIGGVTWEAQIWADNSVTILRGGHRYDSGTLCGVIHDTARTPEAVLVALEGKL